MKAWIQELSKEQLSAELADLGISSEGTLEELRQRMRTYVAKNPTYGQIRGAARPTDEEASLPTPAQPEPGKILGQIRKWGIYFDGKDPLGFLEHLEDMIEAAGYSHEAILRSLPALLKGDALLWHRNNRSFLVSWKEFRQEFGKQFLPPRYRAQLTREILSRTQKPNEQFKAYATEILTKMRRAGGFPADEQVERLYENMSPDYKIYIRRGDVRTVGELSTLAAEFEAIEQQRREWRKPPEVAVAVAYSRSECCWRCKQRGHTRQNCKRPARKFCSQCGKDGVLTKECHPPTGNEKRIGENAAIPRSAE